MMLALPIGLEIALPCLFALGIAAPFATDKTAKIFWIVCGSLALLGVHARLSGQWSGEVSTSLLCPALHLCWFHTLKRLLFGSWAAIPRLTLFDFRASSGSQRETVFSSAYFVTAIALSISLVSVF
ncbi:MAG TPA: hypothetical protein VMF52_01080 [Steroidobacteraceae bacterium]|nr:hypothetical protein [Steroidobacteraceae bacterium]